MNISTFPNIPRSCRPERGGSLATRTVRGVERPLLANLRLRQRASATYRLMASILREIFDESAYERFLAKHQIDSSVEAYAEFSRECGHRKARCARCC